MRKVYLFAATTLALLLTLPASAQVGLFASSGVGITAGFQTGDNTRVMGGGVHYVVNSLFQGGVSFDRETPTYEGASGGITYVTPTIYIYPLREGAAPVTVFVTGHYHIVSVDDAPDGSSFSGWGAGAGVARTFDVSGFSIMPNATLTYTSFKSENAGQSFTNTPIYYLVAVYASVPMGAGTLFFGPIFEGYSEDGSSGNQVGVKAGITLGGK